MCHVSYALHVSDFRGGERELGIAGFGVGVGWGGRGGGGGSPVKSAKKKETKTGIE